MKRPIIAIDIDDVLADYAKGFVDFSNARWGGNLTIDDYDEHWGNVWGLNKDEVRRRADLIHLERMVRNLDHKPEARPVLEKLAQRFELMVVTSRRIQNKDDTLDWLQKYYPMISTELVTFTSFFDKIDDQSIKKTKGSLIASLGASYMIDDLPKHCFSAVDHGVKALLFGSYSWNRIDTLPESITRVADWGDVERYFEDV